MQELRFFNPYAEIRQTQNRLPHWQQMGAVYFVTFRLGGSLPKEIVMQLKGAQAKNETLLIDVKDEGERKQKVFQQRKKYFAKFDEYLDKASNGPRWMQDDRIAKIVAEAIHFRDGKDYELLVYCIMPNHVHMVFTVERFAESLASVRDSVSHYIVTDIIGSLKKHTALEANKVLQRSGAFWQHESYDHVVRTEKELGNIIYYVLNNPVSAHLVSDWKKWKWSYCKYESHLA